MNRDLIEQYAQGGEKLSMAIRGLTREDMLVVPTDPKIGKWTIQQIVIHLMDADLIWAARMKCIIAEDNQVKDHQATFVIGKGSNFVRFGAKLAEEAFQQVG